MSRATRMPLAMCASWEDFSREVPGSGGKVYTVSHGYVENGPYQFGFTCTCPAFQFNPRKECKHILAAKKHACLWHEQFDGGTPEEGKCPECGGPVKGVICAV